MRQIKINKDDFKDLKYEVKIDVDSLRHKHTDNCQFEFDGKCQFEFESGGSAPQE